jgi:hypothetical protein
MLLRYIGPLLFLACALLTEACAKPSVHQAVSTGSLPASTDSQPSVHPVLAGEWEYNAEGAVVLLKLDKRGNGNYEWKGGRFETQALVGQAWHGMWLQTENDRDGGFAVEFSPDFSEGEGRWWYSRIGVDHAPRQKGGTFHLSRRNGSYEPLRHSTGTMRKASRNSR